MSVRDRVRVAKPVCATRAGQKACQSETDATASSAHEGRLCDEPVSIRRLAPRRRPAAHWAHPRRPRPAAPRTTGRQGRAGGAPGAWGGRGEGAGRARGGRGGA
ncbi:unnamed protein product, partial [Iphiclides podalirius]